jgi:hypothetical protein
MGTSQYRNSTRSVLRVRLIPWRGMGERLAVRTCTGPRSRVPRREPAMSETTLLMRSSTRGTQIRYDTGEEDTWVNRQSLSSWGELH